jgi:hypothetical protein
MQGTVATDQSQDSRHQGLTLRVAKLPKRACVAEMFRVIGITAWAGERAFLGDFDRQKRFLAS